MPVWRSGSPPIPPPRRCAPPSAAPSCPPAPTRPGRLLRARWTRSRRTSSPVWTRCTQAKPETSPAQPPSATRSQAAYCVDVRPGRADTTSWLNLIDTRHGSCVRPRTGVRMIHVMYAILLPLMLVATPVASGPAAASDDITLYRCTDADGRVAIQDFPCADDERQ